MKIKEYVLLIVIIFLLASNVFTVWFGYQKFAELNQRICDNSIMPMLEHKPFGHKQGILRKTIIAELNLTQTQRDSFFQINYEFRERMRNLHDSLRFYRDKYDEELRKIDPDFASMLFYSKKIGTFVSGLRQNMLNYHKRLYYILTDEQRIKLSKILRNNSVFEHRPPSMP